MARQDWFEKLNRRLLDCRQCPRLREHCSRIAREKRAAYRDQAYHGRPVPNFGDPKARLLVVGLAPAAHGANRTGRMFTGDRSGDFLFRAMHAARFASQPTATHVGDGLTLEDALITAVAHCAPPDNKPTRSEIDACSGYLQQTFDALPDLRVVVCLGRLAFARIVVHLRQSDAGCGLRQADFAHAAELKADGLTVICSYHPSQQNTFTGRLTNAMLRDVFVRARRQLRGDT